MTLVLLHAFPLDERLWKPQTTLRNDFEILTPDLRGFGTASQNGLEEISIDLAADDVIALLNQKSISRAAIAGISRGGYIAMSLARRYPERLSSLILMDTRATPADEKEKHYWRQFEDRIKQEGITAAADAMLPRLLRPATSPRLVDQITNIILSQRPEAVIAAARGMAHRPDARPSLQENKLPTLTIAGVDDAAFEDTKAIPATRFVAIPDAGHLPNLEQPEAVNAAIRDFLNQAS